MNRRFPALLAALGLLLGLTGCSALLNREYYSSSVHVEYPVSEDASILQAESYQELVNALLYLVAEHQETGVIHLSNYTGAAAADVQAACLEVHTEDPLGAYAVQAIQAQTRQIVSYYEVTVAMEFAHTAEEVAAIVPVTGSSAVKQTLSSFMGSFAPRCALRVSYFTGDEHSLTTLVRQAWLDTPLAALAMPEVGVELYPPEGISPIVEFTLDWPMDVSELNRQRAELESRALELLEQAGPAPTVDQLLSVLQAAAVYDPDGGATAYDAILQGRANDQGMALALRLLCQLADLDATTVEGSLQTEEQSAPRFWLIVSTPEGYRHLDPTAEQPLYATDQTFRDAGYGWEEGRYPDCIDYAAAIAPEETSGGEAD